MSNMTRFTVSIPAELLEALDTTLTKGKENRSAALRRILEEAVRAEQERREVERYVAGYRERPQTDEELGWAEPTALERLEELPW